MNEVKEISLLPINSYELEGHLTDLGLSLLSFAKEYNFSEKCVGVTDCDFIQSIIIEFVTEIKIDFIAYHAVHQARSKGVQKASIIANEHGTEAIVETVIHAQQAGIVTSNFNPDLLFKIRYYINRFRKELIITAYEQKIQRRQKRTQLNTVPKAEPGQFRLLMSTYHPGTVFTLTPVQDRLSERQDVHQVYIANRYETYDKLINMGYKNVISAWSLSQSEKYSVNIHVLKAFVNEFFERAFTFGKATPHFKSRFYNVLKLKLRFAVSLYGPLVRILNEYNPNSIVLSSSSPIDAQIIVETASARKIKVIEITHGIFQETPILKFQNIPIKLVWNQFQADLMKIFKGSINCILVGNPKHDILLEKFKKNPPLNHFNRPYILFATTPGNNNSISQTTYLNILRDFVIAAQGNSEMLFIIKLHPSENKAKVIDDCTKLGFPKNLVIEQGRDVYELIYHAEIVMVVTSTVGYEALLFNKKIITYAIENSEKWLPFSTFNLAIRTNTAQGILHAIRELKTMPANDLVNDKKSYFIYSDGNAVDKTIDIIFANDK